MNTFAPFATRFSVSALASAKAATPAKVPSEANKVSQLSQVSRGRVPETDNCPAPDRWLRDVAKSVTDALSDGAEREADADGWLLLIRPDGRRLAVEPRVVAELDGAGLMPPLPHADDQSPFASRARPACWSDPADQPVDGDRCTCGGGRWWTIKATPDGWCCTTCHPAIHLPPEAIHEVTT